MPTWWGKKSTKTKELLHQEEPRGGSSSGGSSGGGAGVLHFNKSPIRNATNYKNGYYKPENPRSFEDASNFRNSPRSSRDFTPSTTTTTAASSSFWDSDAGDKIGLPLPRPSVSSTQSLSNDQGITFGSASVSGSSVSSNGSCDDPSAFNSQINNVRLVILLIN